jgi:hypothetical protein
MQLARETLPEAHTWLLRLSNNSLGRGRDQKARNACVGECRRLRIAQGGFFVRGGAYGRAWEVKCRKLWWAPLPGWAQSARVYNVSSRGGWGSLGGEGKETESTMLCPSGLRRENAALPPGRNKDGTEEVPTQRYTSAGRRKVFETGGEQGFSASIYFPQAFHGQGER